ESDEAVLQKTPFSFDVSVWEFFWPLLVGARLVVARPGGHRDSAYLADLVVGEGVTTMHFVPSMLGVFVEEPGLARCTSLRRVICSGEALPFSLLRRFHARHRAQLHNLYGPTEAAVDVSYWQCERDRERNIVPIGRPIANVQLYVLDDHLQPAPVGVAGELHIGGIAVARGYWNRPDLTAERFVPDPFGPRGARLYRTGDRARWLSEGIIEYLGRIDQQVKIRGYRIELGEIEAALAAHPAIREAVVTVRGEEADRRLVAYVTTRSPALAGGELRRGESSTAEDAGEHLVAGSAMPDAGELRGFLQKSLPEYMVPSAYVVLPALPLTANGKVDRRALPEPETLGGAAVGVYVAPRNATEEKLAAIWAAVLRQERVGINDNFFHLGGHSLLATQVMTRVREAFGFDLPLRHVFEAPTVAEFAVVISAQAAAAPTVAATPAMTRAVRRSRPVAVAT
ncbi:MAG: AMP-binding protein, partial [Verrucomicrobia bacterium]|nr:AMP-binding protein [Verrucomicrobiota bacterium]